MELLILICVFLTLTYVALILMYRRGWSLQKEFVVPGNFKPSTFISVVIPARNEENNIKVCIDSILENNYSKELFEIIVIDDHSTDKTAEIVRLINVPNVYGFSLTEQENENTVAYKKNALTTGINIAKGELIITTDADCIAPQNWLRTMAAKYEDNKSAMIVAPVDFSNNNSPVQIFQSLDFMSMQGITAAAHRLRMGNMSNGANLAFTKEAFDLVGGYTGIDHLASGDDYLLMMKLKHKYPGGIAYLKSREAIMRTAPQPNWGSFLQQRIRWASKSGKYNDKTLTFILTLVYLFNFSFLFLFVGGLYNHYLLNFALLMLLYKVLAEMFFLFPVAEFFHKRKQLLVFPFLQPLHIIYIVLAGFLGMVGGYKWKGRKVK
jgi:cellulose synthase/poly-beta-1,6-N-acetylglucosamine synthase-like glycosyltransferase